VTGYSVVNITVIMRRRPNASQRLGYTDRSADCRWGWCSGCAARHSHTLIYCL